MPPKAPKVPPSVNIPSNQTNTSVSVENASTTSPKSSATISSKRSARDAALSDNDAKNGATIISHTKSASNASRGSNKATCNTASNALSGLNDQLGEIIPIFKDFNSKPNISLAPPASPVIAPSQTALVEKHFTMSTIVPPITTTSLTLLR
ncbi:hypothetical protein SERLA73DRAFT_69969 [Serpula lacrymans var. lacrymans S7.3]|uniref:Uncharacterized protein n=2 Tax=Serpula lacrymans var. lacrymans TaxID=341189 RepID=F8PLI2_SERL3|nr:uncharacterized protein SERLADRAFT_434047 [Serpula lacrymans var. lacrymans S7.9]EGO02464.1 hypothetical protein SERLA73DRAFT_69969 [Serpula lacrymans var. lacrymans S7.3]EGO28189.1 hypothetical protein SERLADRAFT_434047 [Serpula lacrymans var. lacrymans S7.9]